MTTVRSTCPECGEVDLAHDAVVLDAAEHVYKFVCPGHGDLVVKRADQKIESLLRGAGVRVVAERSTECSDELPPLTSDDLLDFHLLLKNDDELREELFGGR